MVVVVVKKLKNVLALPSPISRSVQDFLSYGCDKNKDNDYCGLWVLSSTLPSEEFKQLGKEMLSGVPSADRMCQYMASISKYEVR